ncbi:MAG: peptide chain release factor N(5)-glutamine methyltransferase [Muribaculaceae bacterium]|nr:peptide chain release factor N(5)-glutamine methyltransferase [Muribaculaceae bacterium]
MKHIREVLVPRFGKGETEAMIRLIFHHLKGWNATDMVINSDKELSEYTRGKIDEILERVLKGEPIQYVTGEAYFYGMDLIVTPDVLIPRVETQELVDFIVKKYDGVSDLKILDIGTGSGCIAIALARNLPFAQVTGIDISEKALAVAKENGKKLKANVNWVKADVFNFSPAADSFDIIVSNPPYVMMSEQRDMEVNVLEHEPWVALFVPDDDPLRFYRRIAKMGIDALKDGGTLWFELNAQLADETAKLVKSLGYEDVTLERDIAGKWRFIEAKKG